MSDSPYSTPASSSAHLPSSASSSAAHDPFTDAHRIKYDLLASAPSLYSSAPGADLADEEYDALHDPGPKAPRVGRARMISETREFRSGSVGWLGVLNVAVVLALGLGLVGLFAGYPIAQWAVQTFAYNTSVSYYNDGAASTSAPNITRKTGPIDPDTPESAYRKMGADGTMLELVFSDEFETPGRLFYPGMDPYWEAVDLHYWQTGDIEYCDDPGNIGTQDGYLYITLTKEDNASSHNTGYLGGMMQTWNKFCWTGGRVEAKVSLPGDTKVSGLWPAFWNMGNLGRAGYGASLEGMWPYSYDFCDIGTLANQTDPETGGPECTLTKGDQYNNDVMSYLIGQRLSRCTCPNEDHPGPIIDGEYLGRSVSQSAQWAPYNPYYYALNATEEEEAWYGDVNDFGTVTSALSTTRASAYNSTNVTDYAMFGVEVHPTYWGSEDGTGRGGYGTGKVWWWQEDQLMWFLSDRAMAANDEAMVSNRSVTGEPLYTIFNLGLSDSFTTVDLENLIFPATMRVDYVRVYQDPAKTNIGCSPPLFPTAEYIETHKPAYTNPNYTDFASYASEYGKSMPKNRLVDSC
ncbi:hypothetical protein JCM10449v2_006601 [Rhodotorula kratochvilovae]